MKFISSDALKEKVQRMNRSQSVGPPPISADDKIEGSLKELKKVDTLPNPPKKPIEMPPKQEPVKEIDSSKKLR